MLKRIVFKLTLLTLVFFSPFLAVTVESASAPSRENTLVSLNVVPMANNRIRFEFEFDHKVTQDPASFFTQKPPRLVLDFIDSKTGLKREASAKKLGIASVKNYRVVSVGNRLRMILDLSNAVAYSGQTLGKRYVLTVNGKGYDLVPKNKQVFVTNQPANAHHAVKNIEFRGTSKQGGRLVIDLSDASVPVDITQVGKEIRANFISTNVPDRLMRTFDVVDFHSPTQSVLVEQKGRDTRFTLTNKGDFGHFAYQVNKQFIIDVFPLTQEEIERAKQKKRIFAGKRISLNFQDIQVRAVLQILAEFTGMNVVVSDKVNGNITLRLNDLPWDQALDIILTTQGLEQRKNGNVILIDTSMEFTAREQQELQETEAAKKLAPIRSELLQINYAKASDIAAMLKDKNSSLLSDRGKLSVDKRTNTIWLQDTGARIQEIQELLKRLDVPVRQVLIEARIVNMKKDFTQDTGIRWGVSRPTHVSGSLDGANQLEQGIAASDVPVTQRLNLDLRALPVEGSPASVGIALAKLGSGILLDLELSALESDDRAEIIASPRLMTTNQQAAEIESGEDIPYQEASSSGATTVAFKKAALSLKVTPQITSNSKLLLDLVIKQDSDSGKRVQGVPIILTKSIETNVLVHNGQTVVLGGIYKQDKNNSITRIPFLGRIPVLGNLFRSKQEKVSNEELLIFITPKIIAQNLSITTIEGQKQKLSQGMGLDKFGKPVP